MRVIGVDCGIALTGWAVLKNRRNNKVSPPEVLGFGVIRTEAGLETSKRLMKLYNELLLKIKKFKPDCMALESLFYFRNQKTVTSVGQARGVIMLVAAKKKIKVYDYTPLQVKQAITGYGKASKGQVQRMVKTVLKLEELPRPDDAADALAIAICHLNTNRNMC